MSEAFTMVSTQFYLYATRREALTVGEGCQSLWWDLRQVPNLVAGFLGAVIRAGRGRTGTGGLHPIRRPRPASAPD